MAKECMQKCPVVTAIEENIKSDTLTDFFNNGLKSALRATDECQGPGEIEVEHQKGFLLWARTVKEPKVVCGHLISSQTEVIETPQPVSTTEPSADDGYFEAPQAGFFETPQPVTQYASVLTQTEH